MKIEPQNVDRVIADVLNNPAASYWLKDALRAALSRDPVDASNDADALQAILSARWEGMAKEANQ